MQATLTSGRTIRVIRKRKPERRKTHYIRTAVLSVLGTLLAVVIALGAIGAALPQHGSLPADVPVKATTVKFSQ